MTDAVPSIVVCSPDRKRRRVRLKTERVTIGRLRDMNDVALTPDPQKLVTRQIHCLIEREDGAWWVVDNGSVNGTFVMKGSDLKMVQGRAPLTDGDSIHILGALSKEGEPRYWELTFIDPLKTQIVEALPRRTCLKYDWTQAKLLLVERSRRTEIDLRPQEHKLVRYMVQRNDSNGGVPVMCTHGELIEAVWGQRTHHGAEDLNHLIWQIRKKIPSRDQAIELFDVERAMGYRLRTCP
jgi:hypothetical protein